MPLFLFVESRPPRLLAISREFKDGIELNWLPPTEPNGEVHYVIYYTPKNGTEQSVDTGSNLTHYNLTGLERNSNIAVEAVNSAGSSDRSEIVTYTYSHTPPVGKPHASALAGLACIHVFLCCSLFK